MTSPFAAPFFSQGRRRWEWLIASIALNLILIGVILSFMLGGGHRQPLVTWQMETLPSLGASDADIVQSATKRIAEQQQQGDAHIHLDYTKVRAVLAVEPLDRESLRQSLTDIAATRDGEQTAIGEIFLDELTSLSPEGRAKVLAAMERESRRYAAANGH